MYLKKNRTVLIPILFLFIFCLFSTVSAVNTTPVGSSLITIVPVSETIEIGDPLEINGYIDESIFGIAPGTVIMIIRAPMSSKIDSYPSFSPNQDGTFHYSVPTDVTGTWMVSARYGDYTSVVSEVKVIPRETIIRTMNRLNSYGTPATVGQEVRMYGYLRDKKGIGIAEKPITYKVAIPPYGCSFCEDDDNYLIWQTYGTAYTDSSGQYSFSFTIRDTGQHRVKAIFAGDEIYQGSISDTRSVRTG
jgi:hypothetical protein